MNYINKNLILTVLGVFSAFVLGLTAPMAALAATTPSLGAAASYGVLASTYTDSTPSATTINGDVGFTTGPNQSTTLGTQVNYGLAGPYSTAGTNEGSALSALATEPCTFNFVGAVNLSTDTTHSSSTGVYAPGVYCSSGAMDVGGPITLSGSGTYIFRPDGALTSDSGSIVTLAGASACDVFWTPTQATTLGANTTFVGTIIDDAGITVGANTTWAGRGLSFGGTITTNTDTINVPVCTAPATLHVIKLLVNANGGTAIPSNFTVHVENAGVDVFGSPAAGAAAPGTLYSLTAGTYSISEDAHSGYTQSFSGSCDTSGAITLSAGDNETCTIINSDIPAPQAVSSGGGVIVPLIGITKVPAPLTLPAGPGQVTYAYTIWNVGGDQPLTGVTVTDDKCGSVTYVSGDVNNNKQLDPHESWKYSCTATLASTTTNTAIATGHTGTQTAVATAIATVVVGVPVPGLPNTGLLPPLINIVKVPSRLTPFPFGGGAVTYTYTVTNPGVVAMNNVSVTDNKCGPVTYVSGDANNNGLLDPGEVWIYTCRTNIAASTTNTATAEGTANGLTAIGYAFATVLVAAPGLPNTGFPPEGNSIPLIVTLVVSICVVTLFYFIIRKKHTV